MKRISARQTRPNTDDPYEQKPGESEDSYMDRRYEHHHKDYIKAQPDWAKLKDKLLSIGGSKIAMVLEEDMEKLLSRGKSWPVSNIRLMKGAPISCHSNAANLYEQNPKTSSIVTGWALGPNDEIWRQHTWLWFKPRKQLIETTSKRKAYFGFELNQSEAMEFCENNY